MIRDALESVIELIRTQRTMVLSTADPDPWSAPVYFVYARQRFYFFSSPKSRHIVAATQSCRCAASVFRDSDSWRDIEGLQMDGEVQRIQLGAESFGAFGAYVRKFPTVKDLFVDAASDLRRFLERSRTQLYAFLPRRVFYLNNRAGIGKRQEIEIPG